jgi:uracil-DNA glycosylase family 4
LGRHDLTKIPSVMDAPQVPSTTGPHRIGVRTGDCPVDFHDMPDAYTTLLDALIDHLEDLESEGARWVQVDPAALAGLAASAPRPAPARVDPALPAPRAPLSSTPKPGPVQPVDMPVEQGAVPSSEPASQSAPEKAAALADLRTKVLACQKCAHLARSRQTVVFGVGSVEASLMFVGEAPGADEDAQGEPFVGAAGQLLTRIIKTMGFTRETVYIANVLKCRPDTPGQSYGNRKPSAEEMRTCLPYLLEQIKLIRPRVIVALGATAMEGLFGRPIPISRVRGHWQVFNETPVMPTYHPSYLLRNQAASVKREVWEDMLQVLEKLGQPITDKQRNYFKS